MTTGPARARLAGSWRAPATAALLAMALRTWVGLREGIIFDDGPRFLASARLILEGSYRAALGDAFHPLTAALIALASRAGGLDLEHAGLLVSVLAGGLGTVALYALARETSGRRVALPAALLFAVFPRMVTAASNVKSDGVHLALFLGGALLAWRALERGRFRDGLGCGILCGLAYLARPEGLAVGVVLGLWLVVDGLTGRSSWGRVLRAAAGFGAGILVFAGPYLVILNSGGGALVLSHKKQVISPGLWDLSPGALAAALHEVARDFQRGWEGLWLLVAGGIRWRRPSRPTLYLCSYVAVFLAILVLVHLEAGYVSRRHWLAPGALLLPLAAAGVLRAGDLVGGWMRPSLRARVAPACVALVVGAFGVHELLDHPDPVKLARRQAALWLRGRDVQCIASHRSRAAYYAGARRFIPLAPGTDAGKLGRDLLARGAEYVIVDAGSLPTDAGEALPGFREIHRVGYAGGEVLVLEVGGPPAVAAPP